MKNEKVQNLFIAEEKQQLTKKNNKRNEMVIVNRINDHKTMSIETFKISSRLCHIVS